MHQIRSANLVPNIRGAENFRPGIADTEYGFAVQGGVKINLPFIAAGDVLWLQAAYAEGAINYLGFGGARQHGHAVAAQPRPDRRIRQRERRSGAD